MKIAQGNPTTYLGHTLTWEKGRQLKKFDNIEYTYNASGIRTSKTVNGRLGTLGDVPNCRTRDRHFSRRSIQKLTNNVRP